MALQQQVDFFADLHEVMFKDALSVPKVTMPYLFKIVLRGAIFTLRG